MGSRLSHGEARWAGRGARLARGGNGARPDGDPCVPGLWRGVEEARTACGVGPPGCDRRADLTLTSQKRAKQERRKGEEVGGHRLGLAGNRVRALSARCGGCYALLVQPWCAGLAGGRRCEGSQRSTLRP